MKENNTIQPNLSELASKKIEKLRSFLFEIGRPPEEINGAITSYKLSAEVDPINIIKCCNAIMGKDIHDSLPEVIEPTNYDFHQQKWEMRREMNKGKKFKKR